MKNICLAAIGLISFMLHFNLTIVAFMKSSALYADEKTILWRSVLEYLSIPIACIDEYLFIDNVIVLIMLNSLTWTCLIVFVIWRLRMFKKHEIYEILAFKYWAVVMNQIGHLKVLIELGAGMKAKTPDSPPETLMQVAKRMMSREIIELLGSCGVRS